ncbi:zinc finger, CCHC-type containing protein [Tanacetum coccineum]
MDGNVHTFKSHLVAKGFTQTYSVDYGETFLPVADIRAKMILLSIVAFYDYDIWQMGVKTALLNDHISEDVYMVQPEGFVDPKHPNKSIFSSCYLFRNPFSSTTMGDENPICTLGDYSKPSHEGYKNTIELPVGNNVDFLKLVDSLDLDSENRERTRLRLFQFSLRDQASKWLERLLAGSISIWEDLTTRFLAQFFPSGRTAKLYNDILMFQQHHGESISEA